MFTETLELEAPFSGELYHEYTFRVQARDLVGHVSDWITTTVAIVNQTKYYFLDGRRVAMRKGDKIYYLYGDHLGSTSLTTDENGVVVSADRYLPYGGRRLSNGISPTDFGFTDQRQEWGIDLYDYNARYYDPFLGKFISPDTIVPEPTSSRGLNRYAYVNNNPLNYVDPSGHFSETAIEGYLAENHENSNELLDRWKNDEAWWAMLSTAEGGDYLFGGSDFYHRGFILQFEGRGIDELTGIKLTMNGYGHFDNLTSLEDIRAGKFQFREPLDPQWGSVQATSDVRWIGLYRLAQDGTPSFYSPGYSRVDTVTSPLGYNVARGVAWTGTVLGSGFITKGVEFGWRTFAYGATASAGFEIFGVSGLADLVDKELTDVNVRIGPTYFNFQQQSPADGGGYNLEHYKWNGYP